MLVEAADGRAVNQALGQAGIWARQILLERPALEEAFLSLTGGGLMRLLRAELRKLARPLSWGVAGAAALFCVLLAVGGAHNAALAAHTPAGHLPTCAELRLTGSRCAQARPPSGPGCGRSPRSPRRSPPSSARWRRAPRRPG